MDLIPHVDEPTELTVIMKAVDEFNRASIQNKGVNHPKVAQVTFKNLAVELLSKYRQKIITRQELFTEAMASGRRLYSQVTQGETDGSSAN